MTLTRVRVREVVLPLVRPLRTAHGEIGARRGWLVEIEGADGVRGFGEALPLPSFGGEGREACAGAIARAATALAASASDGRLPDPVEAATATAPVARCALETALLDLRARRADHSLAHELGATHPPATLAVNALLSGATPEALAREAAAAVADGHDTLKLKVAARPLAEELAAVRAVHAAAPLARIRLDANGGWSEDEAREALRALERLALLDPRDGCAPAGDRPRGSSESTGGIEWVEQPVAPGDPRTLARLRRVCALPLAADESVDSVAAARALLAADAVDALVIKLPTLGGPLRAREVAAIAADAGVRVAVTSFLDSSLGIAAAAQLAATLPQPGPAHGLATARLLAHDIATPWPVAAGRLQLPASWVEGGDERGIDTPGLGITPEADRLASCRGDLLVDVVI